MDAKKGIFVITEEGTIALHVDDPAEGYVTLNYEPDKDPMPGDLIILPAALFSAFSSLAISLGS
jgi:hypothetical protein